MREGNSDDEIKHGLLVNDWKELKVENGKLGGKKRDKATAFKIR